MSEQLDELESNEQAPLLSTAHYVAAHTEIDIADGLHSTPQEVAPGVSYSGHVADHRLFGSGCLTCERGTFSGTFHDNVLTGHGKFSAHAAALSESQESGGDGAAASDRHNSATRRGVASSTTTSLMGLTDDGLDPMSIAAYDGEWEEGVPHGRGTMRWESGDVYEGTFLHGQPHGGGGGSEAANTFTFADGRVYTGEFENGLRDGKGKLTHTNGDVYDGQFVHGTVTGFGTILYARASRIYRGLFEHGRKVKGYLRFPGSQRGYDGEWQDDVPHGAGSMTFANGDFYKGDFAGGELHGVGCLIYQSPAGKVYYGQFVHGQPFGRGFLYEADAVQSDESQTDTAEAAVTEGYFQNGLAVPDSDKAVCESIAEATRGLRMPEAAPPSYTSLLQLRPSNNMTNLTTSFAGFTPSMTNHAEMGSTPPTFASVGPALPRFPTKTGSSLVNRQSGNNAANTTAPSVTTGVSSSPPSANLANGSFARGTHLGVTPLPMPSGEEDDEAIASASSADVDVDEVEADNAILYNEGEEGNASTSVMPSLSNNAGGDGSCRGWLEKCAIGRHNLSLMSKWKRRYFILALYNDNVCLAYYEDDQCHKPIGFIRLNPTDTRIVTCPTTKTHKKASRPGRDLCVIYHEKHKEYKLLLRARDTEDHDRWAAAFSTLFLIVDRPSDFPTPSFHS